MTIVLSGLQLHGFYIGEDIGGFGGPDSNTIKQLALQVTAKFLVSPSV